MAKKIEEDLGIIIHQKCALKLIQIKVVNMVNYLISFCFLFFFIMHLIPSRILLTLYVKLCKY